MRHDLSEPVRAETPHALQTQRRPTVRLSVLSLQVSLESLGLQRDDLLFTASHLQKAPCFSTELQEA